MAQSSKIFVNDWICHYEVTIEVYSDQARSFESTVFEEMRERYDIKKTQIDAVSLSQMEW